MDNNQWSFTGDVEELVTKLKERVLTSTEVNAIEWLQDKILEDLGAIVSDAYQLSVDTDSWEGDVDYANEPDDHYDPEQDRMLLGSFTVYVWGPRVPKDYEA